MSTDLRQQIQQALGSSYTLERELAGGAMSRVFAATETALGRRVVVKVLSPELAAGVSADRFAREIRFTASLQQANIVPILVTGEASGVPFYTMPFVDGLSLRERLSREGRLPIAEAISILRDVARALAYAHERGVVHRDIKPENVLLSGGAAVVTDFGIAKAISIARTIDGSSIDQSTLTSAGVVVGTPAYMAPEQVTGDPDTDHRADLYSFGCLAYELIAGHPPFRERSAHSLFASHIAETPAPVTAHRPDCPTPLAALVMQCLEKRPALRPASAREILARMDSVITPATSPRDSVASAHRTSWLVAAALIAGVLAVYLMMQGRDVSADGGAAVKSIAVLPLSNVGGDSTQEYLADGVTDELTTSLGKIGGVRVASRGLAGRYRGRSDVDVREAGRALGVAYVLQGTLRRVGDKIRVSAQLNSVSDGVELWSERYDRSASDLFSLQDDITRSISRALELRFASDSTAMPAHGTLDPEAYDLYLRGRFLLERRGRGVRQAVDNFRQAIARDSNFARAHAGLSTALALMPYFGDISADEIRPALTSAARRALQQDPRLAEAHLALAMAAEHAYDWATARSEFERAVALAPRDQPVRLQYARFLLYTNRIQDAHAELRLAKTLDPYSALPSAWLGVTLLLLNQPNEAETEMRRALQIDSLNGPAVQMATLTFLVTGRTREAANMSSRLVVSQLPYEGNLGYVLGKSGDRRGAMEIARRLERQRPRRWMSETSLAYVHLGLDDTARALDALERATDAREIWPSYMVLSFHMFDPIRQTPRFAALMRRVGLQDAGFTQPGGGRPR